ncbi:hypothetical protein CSW44_07895 [Thermus scotoductus]|nr:hypothetical protein CSW44_07895 [Thermus scotoductus]
MAKTSYTCVECGYKTPKPLGRCPACGAWESFQEVAPSPRAPSLSLIHISRCRRPLNSRAPWSQQYLTKKTNSDTNTTQQH